MVQPILVRILPNKRYQLIAGERRWLASKLAGKESVPAILRNVSDEQAMEITIVENLQRADLNPMEQARAYDRLSREFKMTQENMAQRTGKDRASVANFLRLLRLPRETQKKVEAGELSFGDARALLALDSPEAILRRRKRSLRSRCRCAKPKATCKAFFIRKTRRRVEKKRRKSHWTPMFAKRATCCSALWGSKFASRIKMAGAG